MGATFTAILFIMAGGLYLALSVSRQPVQIRWRTTRLHHMLTREKYKQQAHVLWSKTV